MPRQTPGGQSPVPDDRNRAGTATERPPTTTPTLPDLDPGLTLLDADSAVADVLYALVVDHVIETGGTACWIDPGHRARCDPLLDIAPTDRILDRITVARGFTPFQHSALLTDCTDWIDEETELVVVPEIDRRYHDAELLADEERDLLLRGIASLATVAREHELPVLVTCASPDGPLAEPIEAATTHRLECTATPYGPRFVEGEETLVYPVAASGVVQTTLSFWAQVIAARSDSPRADGQPHSPEQPGVLICTEVTADGSN